MNRNQLRELRAVAEDAVSAAKDRMNEIEGAINWSDLHCIEARSWMNENGGSGLTIYVEECDPAAYQLQKFITDHIRDRAGISVDVELSW